MQTRPYGDYQIEIYLGGLQGKLPRYPVDYSSLERAATEALPTSPASRTSARPAHNAFDTR